MNGKWRLNHCFHGRFSQPIRTPTAALCSGLIKHLSHHSLSNASTSAFQVTQAASFSCLLSCQNQKAFIKGFPINHPKGPFGDVISAYSLHSGAGWICLLQFLQRDKEEGSDFTKVWSLVSVLQDMLSSPWAVRYFQDVWSFACRDLGSAMSCGIVRVWFYFRALKRNWVN